MIFQSHSPEETKKIAADFAKTLSGGDVIFLEGDLGTGKTVFVQGVAEALGYTDPVRSPTFSIMNIYPIQNHPDIRQIIHLDFYRFSSPAEIKSLGMEEFLEDPHTVIFIEWPEKGLEESAKIQYSQHIKFISLENEMREIKILI